MPTPDTTRPTPERLAEIRADKFAMDTLEVVELLAEVDARRADLAAIADTGSPLSVADLEEMEKAARHYPAIDDRGRLMIRATRLAQFVLRLTGAYREVDAHRCVLADRIREVERHLAMASEAQTRLGDRNAALARQARDIETRVQAMFTDADARGISLDALTAAELTKLVMREIRDGEVSGD